MKNIKIYLLIFLTGILSSCDKDFAELNTNPNQPLVPSTRFLFGSAVTTAFRNNMNGAAGLLYAQHMGEFIYSQESRYSLTQYSYNGIYSGPLMDLQTIINMNTDPATKDTRAVTENSPNANQLGHARILKAFLMLHITDRWGDVPYTDALKGVSVSQPKFDRQKFIYNDLLKELKEASAQITVAMPNDALFDRDFNKWKRWANSLRAIIALRMIKTEDAAIAQTAFNEAVADGLMTANTDNAIFRHLANANFENTWFTNYNRNQRYDYGPADRIIDDEMVVNNDPRLPIFSRTIGTPAMYVGIPYGTTNQVAYDEDASLFGPTIHAQAFPLQLTTYAQICFTMAEAALEGWIPGGDLVMADWYNRGIDASMDQWAAVSSPAVAITTAQKTTYKAQPNVDIALALTRNAKLEKIQTQKWINFYMNNGYEAWAEWRRTGYPVLTPAPGAVNPGGQIPRRQAYPATESNLNNANYQAVISAQGPDRLDTRVWWDR